MRKKYILAAKVNIDAVTECNISLLAGKKNNHFMWFPYLKRRKPTILQRTNHFRSFWISLDFHKDVFFLEHCDQAHQIT